MSNHSSILIPSPDVSPAAFGEKLSSQKKPKIDSDTQISQKLSVQCKLSIGAVDDPLEKEADTMADTIMRMPEQNFIQRKCNHCEEEEKLQRKPLVSFIQRKESSQGATASDAISNQINSSKGSGSSMDNRTQSFMQSRFDTDFSNVKIHTGSESVQMNRELNAKAFTVGNDIYFNEGQYKPNTNEGKYLLAHELTHTIQQSGTAERRKIQKLGNIMEIPPGLSCAVPTHNSIQQTVYLFQNDSSVLSPDQERSIRNIASTWQSSGINIPIRIDGYASTEGEHNYNWALSCSRAERVKNILTANGVADGFITTYMNGETTDFGAANQNRRVNIYLDSPIPIPPPPSPEVDPYFDPVPGDNECSDATFCTPYSTPVEIASARSYLLSYFVPLLEGYFGSDVGSLWRSYLSRRPGDSLAPRVFNSVGNSIHDAFSTSGNISNEVDVVLNLVSSRLSRGYGNVTQRIENFIDPPERELNTNFSNAFSIPGNIAGGIGSSDAGVDYRRITWGNVSFDIIELPGGSRIVTIEVFVNFEVKDAIDFCPGQCGAILEQSLATIKMSRLEASGEAYDVPFIVRFPGPRKTKTIIV